jgi:hypothetical protein
MALSKRPLLEKELWNRTKPASVIFSIVNRVINIRYCSFFHLKKNKKEKYSPARQNEVNAGLQLTNQRSYQPEVHLEYLWRVSSRKATKELPGNFLYRAR